MYKVLIVEDDPMVAMINEQYINRNRDFRVVEKCRDGKSALDFIESNPVDLIVLDVFMPLTDGFETLRQIRRRQIPVDVIMVTAANDRDSLQEALHLGAVDYLVKPFTYDRFRVALDKFIAQTNALMNLETLSSIGSQSVTCNPAPRSRANFSDNGNLRPVGMLRPLSSTCSPTAARIT